MPIADAGGYFEGTAKILRVLFVQVAYGEIEVASGGNQDIIVDVIPELFHAFYLHSVFALADPGGATVDVIHAGPGTTEPGIANMAGIGATLFKRRKTGATAANQQEVHLYLSNSYGSDIMVSYEVFRIAGLI